MIPAEFGFILRENKAADANGALAFGPTWFAKSSAPYVAGEQQRIVGEVVVKYQPG